MAAYSFAESCDVAKPSGNDIIRARISAFKREGAAAMRPPSPGADLDNDGQLDIVAIGGATGNVVRYENLK